MSKNLFIKGQIVIFRHAALAAPIAALLLLTGCNTLPARDRAAYIPLTDSFSGTIEPAAGPQTETPVQWWTIYGDEELNALVMKALAYNTDIDSTRKRFEQAAAVARRTMADLLPDLTVSAERDTTRGDSTAPSGFSLSGAAGYELDIWGKNRAAYKSSDRTAQASIEDIQTSAITVSASIVENWLRLAALREEKNLLTEQIETNKMVLDLQHRRYEGGAADALAVLQQKEVLARAQGLLPDVKAEEEIILRQLAVLTGQNPSVLPKLSITTLPETLPLPDTGLPAQLLENRPDIAAAWLRVEAADWNTHAAWADRLPALDINANYLSSATKLSGLLDIWILNLAASLSAPVFDGGQRKAEEIRSKALADERVITYKDTVITAIAEVENALTRNKYQTETLATIKDQLEASRASLEQAQISYAGGNSTYLSVLNGLVSVQGLERQHIQERRDLALYRVALYRSLGLGRASQTILKGPET